MRPSTAHLSLNSNPNSKPRTCPCPDPETAVFTLPGLLRVLLQLLLKVGPGNLTAQLCVKTHEPYPKTGLLGVKLARHLLHLRGTPKDMEVAVVCCDSRPTLQQKKKEKKHGTSTFIVFYCYNDLK